MLEAMKTMAQRSVMEKLALFVNHVISAEPAALDKLRPHAGRHVLLELEGWPALLPQPGPFAFLVTPAGLVEWVDEAAAATVAAPDLRVAIAAGNPAALLARMVTGERPKITVSGDAAFAGDLDWLIDNLRWDAQDDLARFVGDGPARELSRLGRFVSGAVREAARTLRDLAPSGPGAAPEPPPGAR